MIRTRVRLSHTPALKNDTLLAILYEARSVGLAGAVESRESSGYAVSVLSICMVHK